MIPNPQFRCSIIAILLTLSSAASKGEEKNNPFTDDPSNPFADSPPAVAESDRRRPPPSPDHLVPPTLNTEDYQVSYHNQLKANLRLDAPCLALMLVKPSFESEYSLLLQGDGNTASIKDSKSFSLTLTKAVGSIWESMPWNNDDEKQRKVTVKISTAPISPALAARMHGLWNRMISRAHKPTHPNTTFDGVSYEFATAIGRGEAQNPSQRNSPALLTDLGECLVQYCQAPEEEREEILKEINKAADALETYLKEHSQEEKPKTGEEK